MKRFISVILCVILAFYSYSFAALAQEEGEWYDITQKVTFIKGGVWRTNGQLLSGNPYYHCELPVEAGETYRISGYNNDTDRLFQLKNSLADKESIMMCPSVDVVNKVSTYYCETVTIPENCNYLLISFSPYNYSKEHKIEKLNNAILQDPIKEGFALNFDMVYATFTFDDSNIDISEIETLFEKHNMPACYATVPSRLGRKCLSNETVKEVLERAEKNGGEVLSHNEYPLTSQDSLSEYYKIYGDNKLMLQNAGFTVNGIITAGGYKNGYEYKTQNFAESIHSALGAKYLYGDLTGEISSQFYGQYINRRYFLDQGVDAAKSKIDSTVQKGKGWLNFASHGYNGSAGGNIKSLDDIEEILIYLEEKDIPVVTWNYVFNNLSNKVSGTDNKGYNDGYILHNHNENVERILEEASCTATGKKSYTCSLCGEEKTEIIPKTDHTYKAYVTKATTKKNGSIVTKCSVCGDKKSSKTIHYPKTIKLSKTSYTYNGKVKTPSVTVKDSKGKTLNKNTDYTVTYAKGRKNVGKYSVKIAFKGNYSGSKALYFTIIPKATTISSVTAKSKGFTVKWKKQTSQTTGYQIQYSTSSKFKSAKTVTVSKNKTTSKTISKQKAKKKYYVRVRTYKTVNGNKIYSSWSKSKSVTTKK